MDWKPEIFPITLDVVLQANSHGRRTRLAALPQAFMWHDKVIEIEPPRA